MGGNEIITSSGQMDSLRQKYALRKVNKLAQDGLAELLGDVFSLVSEALIVEAGKCEGTELQRVYFDSLCELYAKKEVLLNDYKRHFSHYFYRTSKPEGWDSGVAVGIKGSDESCKPSVEEALLAQQLLTHIRFADEGPLERLTQQFSFILGKEPIPEQMPVGLHAVVVAFRDTLTVLSAPEQVKKCYYFHWQQQLNSRLVSLWADLADCLENEIGDPALLNIASKRVSAQGGGNLVPALVQHLQQRGGHEKVLQVEIQKAAQRVDEVLKHKTQGRKVVEPVSTLLHGPWRSLLIAIWVEEGEQSIRWEIAQQVTTELLWSIQPKTSQQQRSVLTKRLPQLLRALRHSLQDVTWEEVDSERIFGELEQLHLGNLRDSAKRSAL